MSLFPFQSHLGCFPLLAAMQKECRFSASNHWPALFADGQVPDRPKPPLPVIRKGQAYPAAAAAAVNRSAGARLR